MVDQKIGLTLSGGGARGAYQAGVLKAISDLCGFKKSPFDIISGVSAGSINGMALAAGAQDFAAATQLMWDTWIELRVNKIFKTDLFSMAHITSSWLLNLSLGEWVSTRKVTYLLDSSPLKELLTKKIDMGAIGENLRSGLLHGVALSATDYRSGKSVTFFDGNQAIPDWDRNSGIGKRTILATEHIMASTAIPIFFPPVRIGKSDYGDGGIGQSSPLSPAIRLGADRIMVIGLEHMPGHEEADSVESEQEITLGDIAGTLLNSLFLKTLDSDVMRLKQTNKLLSAFSSEQLRSDEIHLIPLPALFIRPSKDLGKIDMDQFARFPYPLRHLLKGLGINDFRAWDLLSYLAFEKEYALALLELGYKDAINSKNQIVGFFNENQAFVGS
ncbi:MAG: patatin-like phospholipase family protein [Chitinophagaceae bacterium]|nr:patatin-like phospholipase family protein [Oligoflexus sp.]